MFAKRQVFRHPARPLRWSPYFVLATFGSLIAACGSPAIEGPDDADAAPDTTVAGNPGETTAVGQSDGADTTQQPAPTTKTTGVEDDEEEEEYTWGLPLGDETVSINEDVLYRMIQRSDCEEAQSYLDENWNTLQSPRAVLLYQAGVFLCAGETEQARRHFKQAEANYGWTGIARPYLDCNVYQAAGSLLRQQPPSDFPCPPGTGPPWPSNNEDTRDDPRTAEDETLVTSTTGTTETTSTTSITSPADP